MSKQLPLIFGISGFELSESETKLFKKYQIPGIILFNRNIQDKEQLESLIASLKNLNKDMKIFIDQEGGKVQRLKSPLIPKNYPSAGSFSEIYDEDKAVAMIKLSENYKELMLDLKAYKIDSPCAPVADISYPEADNVIGDRSFGKNPKKVIDLSSAAIDGIIAAGGIAIMKHLPGHGRAVVDSHEKLPHVTTDIKELEKTDFLVFKELSKKYKDQPSLWAMTAHILFDALDTKSPVTTSPKAIEYIRKTIGFTGTLITDALEMKALHSVESIKDSQKFRISIVHAAIKAKNAGCDYILHCNGDIAQMTELCDTFSNFLD